MLKKIFLFIKNITKSLQRWEYKKREIYLDESVCSFFPFAALALCWFMISIAKTSLVQICCSKSAGSDLLPPIPKPSVIPFGSFFVSFYRCRCPYLLTRPKYDWISQFLAKFHPYLLWIFCYLSSAKSVGLLQFWDLDFWFWFWFGILILNWSWFWFC